MPLTETWAKSSFSWEINCVEVRKTAEHVLVRDTKDNGTGPTLTFTADEWTAFLAGVRNGEFDFTSAADATLAI